jgi:hypothetical protein
MQLIEEGKVEHEKDWTEVEVYEFFAAALER